jgi:hypothetical protein
MSGIKHPPLHENILGEDGRISKVWYRFFEDMKNWTDKISDEVIEGKWQIKQRPERIVSASDVVLTSGDFGKSIVMEIGSDDYTVTLPSVGSTNTGVSLTIVRIGDGRLTIQAADSDTIERSRPGGGIYCHESHRMIANVTLYLASATEWGITGATGIWFTF